MRRIALALAGLTVLAIGFQTLQINLHAGIFSEPAIIVVSLLAEYTLFILVILLWRYGVNEHKKTSRLEQEKLGLEIQVQEQSNYFDKLFESANNGVVLLNLDGYIARANKSFFQLLGYYQDKDLHLNFYNLIQQDSLSELQKKIQMMIDSEIETYEHEQQCTKKNGELVWVLTTFSLVRNHQGTPIFFLAHLQNIDLQKEAEEKLRHMAYHDPLTGLANRNKLEQFINHILASSRRQQTGFAVMFVDLDGFKNINDSIGHDAGDMILQIVAERMRCVVRNTDMVARMGGDEFILLITDVRMAEAAALIAQKVLDSILEVIVIQGQEIYMTANVGMSLYPNDGQNIPTLMKHADLALYRSKDLGRNTYQFYTVEMTSKAQEKLALQSALGHALAKDEFLLNYQPKMELKTRKITGVEALLRWRNNEYVGTTPSEIISLADETGLIIPVSNWILKTACAQLRTWHNMGFTSLVMAVNCSGRQFKHSEFVEDVLTCIKESRILPSCLEIEITESVVMDDPENTLRVLYQLKDLGVQIVIDDFGTGYWSLNNLRRLSVSKVKIDKTFIKQCTHDETAAAITTAIIAMASKLGIKTVAEGVETREQYEFLLKEGCTEIQGYYLTQPLTNEMVTKFLKHPVPDAEVISTTVVTP